MSGFLNLEESSKPVTEAPPKGRARWGGWLAGAVVAAIIVVLAGWYDIIPFGWHTGGIRKAVADLEGSATVGMSYLDFVHKLQDFSSAITLAKQQGAGERALLPYEESLEIYLLSQDLWKQKIDCPAAFGNGDPAGCPTKKTFDVVRNIAEKFNVPFDDFDKATIAQYEREEEKFERPGGYPNFPPSMWGLQRINGTMFDKLLSAMWGKAAETANQ